MRWLTPKWALTTGLRFETKGMNAGAKVKNYQMTLLIENGDKTGEMSGRFTGRIKTRVQNEYITLPILVVRELPPLGDQTRPLHRLPHRRQLYRVGFRRLHPRRRSDRHQSRRRIGDVRLRIRTAPFQLGRPVRRRVAGIPSPVGLCRPDLCRELHLQKRFPQRQLRHV